ncbi:MAG: CDP-glycerol glycerophosphotransferase family protein [Clostridia bacterium]|nr:CDP-glycerol glycerophosphotransferase family protein [Clostridia bacterium]
MKQQFKFSIIMSVYKVEDYLEEAVDSVINQNIGFKDNIQLILVNDGSPDNSEEICLRYKERYPDNVVYVKKENGGLADARNVGLEYVEGEIVNFCDPDDILEKDVCSLVYKFFQNHSDINLASIRIRLFEAQTGFKHPLNYKFSETRVFDIFEEPNCVQLSAATSFIKAEALKDLKFNTGLKVSEDFPYIGELILNAKKYGVIREAVYNYRKRFTNDSILGLSQKNESWYIDTPKLAYQRMIDLSIEKFGKVVSYVQYAVMYDLQWRIKRAVDDNIDNRVKDEYIDMLKKLIGYIDIEVIFNMRQLPVSYMFAVAKIKDPNFENHLFVQDNAVYFKNDDTSKPISLVKCAYFRTKICILEQNDDGTLHIEGLSLHQQLENIKFRLVDNFGNEYPLNIGDYKHYQIVDNFGNSLGNKRFFADVELKPGMKLLFKASINDTEEFVSKIKTASYSKISETIGGSFYVCANHIVRLYDEKLCVTKRSKGAVIVNELKYMLRLLKRRQLGLIFYRTAYYIAKCFKKKPIWIISDRLNAANDNGVALYKYLLENEKDTDIYFTLSKKYDEYNKFRGMKGLLPFGNFKYKLKFLMSDAVISAQADEPYLNPFGKKKSYMKNLYNFKFVFLQHGITKDDISGWLNKLDKNIKLFVTASPKEHESILKYPFYYTEKEVKATGFSRYDLLENRTQKKILLMPTWRKNIAGKVQSDVSIRQYNEFFKESDYYKFYNGLINNEKLIKALKEYGYEFHFYIHPSITYQSVDFKSNDYVTVHTEIADYNKEFCEGAVLITDYSSVAFDFAYLGKPVIYSQFDKETFYQGHLYNA